MKSKIKSKIKNCLATTALVLILLGIIALLYGAQFLCITTLYEVLLANIVLHIGLSFVERFESTYCLIEILVEIGYCLIVMLLFGMIFDWYSTTPLWILILLVITVYIAGSLIDLYKINSHLSSINKQLSYAKRKEDE